MQEYSGVQVWVDVGRQVRVREVHHDLLQDEDDQQQHEVPVAQELPHPAEDLPKGRTRSVRPTGHVDRFTSEPWEGP